MDFGRPTVWGGFCKGLTVSLSPGWAGLSPRRDEGEECLEGGSAGFQDCSETDCLKVFGAREGGGGGREGGREIGGGLWAPEIEQTIFQHVYLDRDEDKRWRLSQPLVKSYFTFGRIYFSVKQKKKRETKRRRSVKGSFQLQKKKRCKRGGDLPNKEIRKTAEKRLSLLCSFPSTEVRAL